MFEKLAVQLAGALAVEISQSPRRLNYVLAWPETSLPLGCESFIPLQAIHDAADKRTIARKFIIHGVAMPETVLLETFAEVQLWLGRNSHRQWCLKYPTGCGGSGHRMIHLSDIEPTNWSKPYVVQEFIASEHPEVFRTYCCAGDCFGWMVRRFPEGARSSPWVAHARGARYFNSGRIPAEAEVVALCALNAMDLLNSFGCVDLIRASDGRWLALEVGTDGIFNHVDRELGDRSMEAKILRRIALAFQMKRKLI